MKGNSFRNVSATDTLPNSNMKVVKDLSDIDMKISELESLKLQQLKKQAEYEESQRAAKDQERIDTKRQAEEWERKAELYKDRDDIDEALANAKKCWDRFNELSDMELPLTAPNSALDFSRSESEVGFFERVFSHWATLVVASLFFLACGWFCFHQVEGIGDKINALNSAAMASGNNGSMLPPSISMLSYQKLWYSGLLVFCSLIVSLLIMAIIAPAQLFFILPFTSLNNTTKWKSFYEQSENQKQWQSLAYLALILLFISACLVK